MLLPVHPKLFCMGTLGFKLVKTMAFLLARLLGLMLLLRPLRGLLLRPLRALLLLRSVVDHDPRRRERGATVIADYGHNPDAMRALASAIEAMKPKRSHVVISGAGDRRDEDIRDLTRVLGNSFDNVILYQDACQRGREDGEVLKLLQEGLVGATKAKEIKEIHGEFLAIDTALNEVSAGDICLILIDQVEAALAYIQGKVNESQEAVV